MNRHRLRQFFPLLITQLQKLEDFSPYITSKRSQTKINQMLDSLKDDIGLKSPGFIKSLVTVVRSISDKRNGP